MNATLHPLKKRHSRNISMRTRLRILITTRVRGDAASTHIEDFALLSRAANAILATTNSPERGARCWRGLSRGASQSTGHCRWPPANHLSAVTKLSEMGQNRCSTVDGIAAPLLCSCLLTEHHSEALALHSDFTCCRLLHVMWSPALSFVAEQVLLENEFCFLPIILIDWLHKQWTAMRSGFIPAKRRRVSTACDSDDDDEEPSRVKAEAQGNVIVKIRGSKRKRYQIPNQNSQPLLTETPVLP